MCRRVELNDLAYLLEVAAAEASKVQVTNGSVHDIVHHAPGLAAPRHEVLDRLPPDSTDGRPWTGANDELLNRLRKEHSDEHGKTDHVEQQTVRDRE